MKTRITDLSQVKVGDRVELERMSFVVKFCDGEWLFLLTKNKLVSRALCEGEIQHDYTLYLITEPTYRPYESYDEAKEVLGKVIEHKNSPSCRLISHVNSDSMNGLTFRSLFDNYTLEDGTPVGVRVEGENHENEN